MRDRKSCHPDERSEEGSRDGEAPHSCPGSLGRQASLGMTVKRKTGFVERPLRFLLIPVLAAILVVGCRGDEPQRPHSDDALARGAVCHVVVFWLKQPGNADARRRVIDASYGFASISGVVSVEAGEMLPSPRPNVDKTYDVAVAMWFRDRDALEAYQSHPQHQEMLKEVGPLVERVVVYDFTRGESAKK